MRTWLELKEILEKKCISESDQVLVQDFLIRFSFLERQTLLGILIGFEEKIEFFVNLIKQKSELKNSPNKDLTNKILDFEQKELKALLKDLKI